MSLNIKHKRSATAGSAPTGAQLEDGELAVNYAATDPAIYLKDSSGNIRRIAGADNIAIDGSGNTGDIGYWNRTGVTLSPVNTNDQISAVNGRFIVESSRTSTGFEHINITSTEFGDAAQGNSVFSVLSSGTIRGRNELCLGGDQTSSGSNIYLNGADGSSTFKSIMRVTRDALTTATFGTSTQTKFAVRETDVLIGTDLNPGSTTTNANIELKSDGSAEFAGTVNVFNYNAASDTTAGVNIGNGIISIQKPSTATGSVFRTKQGKEDVLAISSDGTLKIGNGAAANPNITLETGGDGTFAGIVEAQNDIISRTTVRATVDSNNTVGLYPGNDAYTRGALSVRGGVNGQALGIAWRLRNNAGNFRHDFLTCHANDGWRFYTKNTGADFDGTETPVVTITRNGSAEFVGTITTQGGAGGPYVAIGETIIFHTDADNPANYTTTTDAEGTETTVYNGPTLDVKERLEAARETFQELQIAVSSATDFASLKAAMLVALEDWSA